MLREELGDSVTATDTVAKLVHALTTGTAVPDWVDAIGPGSLVIVDEAGMAGTLDLAAVVDYAAGRGASVRLVGDDRQLAAVGAGGVLRDIDRTHGAVTLCRGPPLHPPRRQPEPRRSRRLARDPRAATRPASATTSTTAASTSATTPPPPTRRSPRGPPTVPPVWTRCSSPSTNAQVRELNTPRPSRPAGAPRAVRPDAASRSPTQRQPAMETRSSPAATTVA